MYRDLFSRFPKVPLRLVLSYELKDRRQKNDRYSLRAFASSLQMTPSTLSRFLKGERVPSPRILRQICEKLDLPADQISELEEKKKSRKTNINYTYLEADRFEGVAFRDFALIELLRLNRFEGDLEKLADFLQISSDEVLQMKNRLEAFGLLRTEGPFWIPTHTDTSFLTLGDRSIEKRQLSMMESAIQSIKQGQDSGGAATQVLSFRSPQVDGSRPSRKLISSGGRCRSFSRHPIHKIRSTN